MSLSAASTLALLVLTAGLAQVAPAKGKPATRKPAAKASQSLAAKAPASTGTAKPLAPAAKSSTPAGKKTTAGASPAKKTLVAGRRTTVRPRSRRLVARAPVTTPVVRAAANDAVARWLDVPGSTENPAALIPFFEQLYRLEQNAAGALGAFPASIADSQQVLRVFHYGDSHTAADDWSGTLRYLLQERFGDGGNGFSHAGRPWNGYRRLDLKSSSSSGWYSDGLGNREGDGVYGLAGVSMSTRRAGETVSLQTDLEQAEFHYMTQPGGGRVELTDNGAVLGVIDTDGEHGPAIHKLDLAPGTHQLAARTLDFRPVRLHGWVTENNRGITWEMMGINGAQASVGLKWDDAALTKTFEQRPPALIVLAYGTNEARNKDWTYESYREMFTALLARYRQLAPAASILVIGPPDHLMRGRAGWAPVEKIDVILQAQRDACRASGTAFWDLRDRMGGKGAMRQWVMAGMAQGDYVHFTGSGYRLLGAALYKELMGQYAVFSRLRRETMQPKSAGSSTASVEVGDGQALTNN